jgi:hypothetical protein
MKAGSTMHALTSFFANSRKTSLRTTPQTTQLVAHRTTSSVPIFSKEKHAFFCRLRCLHETNLGGHFSSEGFRVRKPAYSPPRNFLLDGRDDASELPDSLHAARGSRQDPCQERVSRINRLDPGDLSSQTLTLDFQDLGGGCGLRKESHRKRTPSGEERRNIAYTAARVLRRDGVSGRAHRYR